jgi:hypothetical protein
MRRRTCLARLSAVAVGAASTAGCLGAPSAGTTTSTPEPPAWLHESADCAADGSSHRTTFVLGSARSEPLGDATVVRYRSLSPDARRIVDFALRHGAAETCVYALPDPFRELVDAVEEATEDGRTRPSDLSLYVEAEGAYHEVGLQVADQVFAEPGAVS